MGEAEEVVDGTDNTGGAENPVDRAEDIGGTLDICGTGDTGEAEDIVDGTDEMGDMGEMEKLPTVLSKLKDRKHLLYHQMEQDSTRGT